MNDRRGAAYRFDELGWAQFEQVCDELLAAVGCRDVSWRGRADELRVALVDELPALTGRVLTGPVLVALAWVNARRSHQNRALGALLAEAGERHRPGSVLVVTNARGSAVRGLEAQLRGEASVLDADALDALVDAHPVVRRRVPSLLGVRELSDLLAHELPGSGSWDEAAARELARVFVPTRAYRAGLDVLERHGFAVLSGPPEMGKTAIARVLGLAFRTEGWEVHECIRPEQVWAVFDRDRPQLFIADDAFGSTEYRPDAAERWALDLDRILRALDGRHRLVWTSRPAPLRAGLGRIHREHGVERFPRPAEVNVDAANLDVMEKALILYRHARAAELERDAIRLVRDHGVEIVEHTHFTPERIKRFVARRLPELASARTPRARLTAAIEAEIAEPTAAMAASFDALPAEHRALLVGLVDTPPGLVSERDLAAAARRHAPAGLPRPPAELVDRLTDHFIRVVPPTSVTWVHPSWRDLVIERLASDSGAGRRFVERCSLDGALLALSRGGGAAGERRRPLLVRDGDWDALTERLHELVPTLADPDLSRLLVVLEDGLTSPEEGDRDAGELAALAVAVLSAIARCWERQQSFASYPLLEQWWSVSSLLEEPPRAPANATFWTPPPVEHFEAPVPDRHPPPLPSVDWGAKEQAARLVERILADLEAA